MLDFSVIHDERNTCDECDHKTHVNTCRMHKRNKFIAFIQREATDVKHRCEYFKVKREE